MGRQIIIQPNGLYCVWSSVSDSFVKINYTEELLIEEAQREAAERIAKEIHETIEELKKGGKPSYQFTMSFKEAIRAAKQIHGKNDEWLQEVLRETAAVPDPDAAEP